MQNYERHDSLPQKQENIVEQLKKTLSPETQKYLDDLITTELDEATWLARGEMRKLYPAKPTRIEEMSNEEIRTLLGMTESVLNGIRQQTQDTPTKGSEFDDWFVRFMKESHDRKPSGEQMQMEANLVALRDRLANELALRGTDHDGERND